jgi:hypothetical protein
MTDEELGYHRALNMIAKVHMTNDAQGWSVSRAPSRDDLTIVDSAIAEIKGESQDGMV